MLKSILLSSFLVITLFSFSQNILKGKITNKNGEGIPGVKVYVENSTYGVITDYNGNYFIEFKNRQYYPIHFGMLGMVDTIPTININKKITVLDITLQTENYQLESVEVIAKKKNIANSIIKNLQKNRKKILQQYDNYTCNTYLKTGLEKERIKLDTSDNTPLKMNLIESISLSTFIQPNTYHAKVIAHHDYSDNEESSTSSTIEYYIDDIITPEQSIETNPYIFFEKIQDGDFNLYKSMLNLPKISEHPITSPIGVNAFLNYKYKLASVFIENGKKIYQVEVIPRFKSAPLFKGTIYIIKDEWIIKSLNLSINSDAMPFFKEFTVIQDYEEINNFWVPIRREFVYNIKEEAYLTTANTRVKHTNYQFNQPIKANEFKNEILSYTDNAFSQDSTFWSTERPIQLKQSELDYIIEQNKIDSIKQSKHYLDSIDAVFNKVTFWDVTLNGMGFRNRFKKQEIFIAPLLGNVRIFGVGGLRYNFEGHYSKQFENKNKIKVTPTLNYGFLNKDLKPKLAIDYTFLPLKFGAVEIEGGDTYDRITNQLTAVNWLLGGNSSIRNQFISLGYRQEIVNGLYGRIKFSYSDKRSIENLDMGPIVGYLNSIDTTEIELLNEPITFERYKMALIEFKFHYRFKQKYIIKNDEKLIIGSEYPEIELIFKQGIPTLFNSEVNFNLIEFRLSDEINFGNLGDSKWKVIGGSFINRKKLRIIEHKYFKESDVGFFSNPLNSHQTLDSTLSTDAPYIQAFYLHHFNGFFLNKIPLINRLKFESIAGMSILLINEYDYSLTEFFIGVEKKFKIKNQYLKYGFYYAGRFDNLSQPYFKFKLGLDFLNTFTNKWSY